MNWTHDFHRVCKLLDPSLEYNISEVNIYVFGGSMTFGQSTDGCCCNVNKDSNCPNNTCMEHFQKEEGDTHQSFCSWSRYFGRWIQLEYPHIKINVINLAERGWGSKTASEYLLARYPPNTEKSFRSNDIVLLDFSVNDCSGSYGEIVGGISEGLVRRFRLYGDDMPILILLETFPIRIAGQYFTMDPPGSGGVQDYTTYYRKVARYYNISLWSYATSVFIDHTIALSGFQYFRFPDAHPSWFAHLNVADTYASVFKHEFHKYCVKQHSERVDEMKEELKKKLNHIKDNSKTLKYEDIYLPPPYFQGVQECHGMEEYFADAKAEYARLTNVPFNSSLSSHELEWEVLDAKTKTVITTSSQPISNSLTQEHHHDEGKGMWSLYEDRHTKPGWIIMQGDGKESILRFSLKNVNLGAKYVPIVGVSYLRTYEHAGRTKISVCGEEKYALNALWPDYQYHRVSVPEMFYFDINIKVCKSFAPHERWIEFFGPWVNDRQDKFKIDLIRIC